MARPKKLNADFFSHDCDMRNDIKLRNIRRKFGHEGYSLWNMILEFLGDCDYFEYEWTDENIELLEPDFDMDADRIKEIVNRMIHLDLLQIMNGYITCDKFTERLFDMLSNKRSDFDIQKSHRYTIERNKLHGNSIKGYDNPYSRVKESKGEESGEQNRGVYESILPHSKAQNTTPKESLENSTDYQFDVEDSDFVSESTQYKVENGEELKSIIANGFRK